MQKPGLTFLAICLIYLFAFPLISAKGQNFDHTHSRFNTILEKYVHGSRVDYAGLKSSREELEEYTDILGSVSEDEYKTWTDKQKLAFWINCYNAFTLKVVVENYPIERSLTFVSIFYAPASSILQIPGVWDDIEFNAAGKKVTLDQIEHEILRKKFDEPRIHVAINCASESCPDLRAEAYTADRIEAQLVDASYNFVNDESKGVKINLDEKELRISSIFKWFGSDFEHKYGNQQFFQERDKEVRGVLGFIYSYLKSEKEKEFLNENKFSISYMDYDWSLNNK